MHRPATTPGAGTQPLAVRSLTEREEELGIVDPTSPHLEIHATTWHRGTVTDLGTLGGKYSFAYSTNDRGQVVGQADLVDFPVSHAAMWYRGSVTDLGTLGGTYSAAYAVNQLGEAVGSSYTSGNQVYLPTLFQDGRVRTLGLVSGDSVGEANALNNLGQIVGDSGGATHAWVWQNGVTTDLNLLIQANSGWQLLMATGINDRGQIVGAGFNPNGQFHGFLLNPRERRGDDVADGASSRPAASVAAAVEALPASVGKMLLWHTLKDEAAALHGL